MREQIYTPGPGRVPPELAGREEVLQRWASTLRAAREGERVPKDVLHTGSPGSGRTVLLDRLLDLGTDAGYRVLRVRGGVGPWLRDGLAPELAALGLELDLLDADETDAFAERVSRLAPFLAEVLTDLAATGTTPGETPAGATDAAAAGAGAGRGLVLAVDDVDLVDAEEVGRLGAATELLETAPGAPVLLVGTGGPDAWDRLRGRPGGPVVNDHPEKWFDLRPLPALSPQEAARSLVRPADRAGVIWQPEAVEVVVAAAAGHPGRLQHCAAAVWALGSGTEPVTPAHARDGLRRVELPSSYDA